MKQYEWYIYNLHFYINDGIETIIERFECIYGLQHLKKFRQILFFIYPK